MVLCLCLGIGIAVSILSLLCKLYFCCKEEERLPENSQTQQEGLVMIEMNNQNHSHPVAPSTPKNPNHRMSDPTRPKLIRLGFASRVSECTTK